MKVHIYVEGGGDQNLTLTKCRRGFSQFFKKIVPSGYQPKIIACGSRMQAYNRFCTAIVQYRDVLCILLVDSEAPVADNHGSWRHLKVIDNWNPPSSATDDNAYLMVQCMESWFLADRKTLAEFYGQGFNLNALPKQQNIEKIAKNDLNQGLDAATRHTKTKGKYHKVRHGFDILAKIDPQKVAQVSKHAKRLFNLLSQ
ncbi:DUF4276 family protein [Candidatus Marithrix sp. Canyon 246]|uniref:DUF4276 family protein n=1 Tax=Candidatus Marithrix sp. Canyon 246 TaxID=1827136 RepID=UPI000849FE73|nr:DUF4276 family protein [Candidatus Marithrix sp. Canyon 246]